MKSVANPWVRDKCCAAAESSAYRCPAKRRVSFAPEATLHTWDVIEYMRDATTSSASSNSTRRASNAIQEPSSPERGIRFSGPDSDPAEPPSTPPEQLEDDLPSSSPEKQRDLHQKKRRRSSGVPPMNFNNPDDELSSSPYSGSSAPGSDDIEIVSDDNDDDDDGSTMMSLDTGDEPTMASVASNDSTGSSARLDAALRQAAEQAGTQRFQFEDEDDGEASMELAGDEITAAFKPWVQRTTFSEDKENAQPDPFAFKLPGPDQDDDSEGEEMSMDITRAIGGIIGVPREKEQEPSPEPENVTMDFTTAIGSIQSEETSTRAGTKRRRSVLPSATEEQGSPAKRQASRRMSIRKRRSVANDEPLEDGTMDFTTAVGGIKPAQTQDKKDRRESMSSAFEDATMDFTMAMGGIKNNRNNQEISADDTMVSKDDNEDLSMEFTAILGKIQNAQQDTPATPESKKTAAATPPSKRGSAARFTNNHPEVPSPSPMKVSNAVIAKAESPIAALKIHKDTTPRKSPRKSPQKSPRKAAQQSPRRSLRKSVGPAQTDVATTPEPVPVANTPQQQTPEKSMEESIAEAQAALEEEMVGERAATPVEAETATPTKEPALRAASVPSLMDSIKLLSTPRKQVFTSPLKRSVAATPREAASQKTPSPKKTPSPRKSSSPQKQVQFGVDEVQYPTLPAEEEKNGEAVGDEEPVEQIQLQEFLEMTGIRFMELTTTKRRHTGYPGAQNAFGRSASLNAAEIEGRDDLETCVVAAACTEPEYLMYQHACHELKKYISEGKNLVRQMEEEVYEENPVLFRDYMSAPADQRAVMDNQFKNMKTNARLRTKEAWYGWRSNLLHDIKAGLTRTADSFNQDDAALKKQEQIIDSTLPALQDRHANLQSECKQLQRRAEELNGPDREELDATRERIIAAEAAIEEKKRKVQALQQQLAEKEARIEAAKERKVECVEETQEAERVREECRGWSVDEVNAVKTRVTALEKAHGWTITSASASPEKTLTMSYRNDLQLFFHPGAFAPHAPSPSSPNGPISLTYIGDAPLTTTKRFFLQVLRANLHCLPQATTRVPRLLAHLARGWDACRLVAANARRLALAHVTDELILSDERMAVHAAVLLPSVQSKVRIAFEIAVANLDDDPAKDLHAAVSVAAKAVYGEAYKEAKMAEFIQQYVGRDVVVGAPGAAESKPSWGEAVGDLRERLIARGKKGGRID